MALLDQIMTPHDAPGNPGSSTATRGRGAAGTFVVASIGASASACDALLWTSGPKRAAVEGLARDQTLGEDSTR